MPEGADELGSALGTPQRPAGLSPQFGEVLGAEISQRVLLEMPPDVFDRVEFRRVSGQARQRDRAPGALDPLGDHAAAMHRQAVPDDEQRSADLPPQRREELHCLRPPHRAGKEPEVEAPPSHPGDDRELPPAEGEVQLRSATARGPSRGDAGPLAQAALVDEDKGAPLAAGFFLRAGHHQAQSGSSQFSIRRPGTREKWRTLPVTTVRSRESAIEAIRRSGSSSRFPIRSRSARSAP